MPFSAPLTSGLASTVFIAGKPAALAGASGMCVPPHVGLHPSDPFFVPAQQKGTVMSGSATVLIEGKAAATAQSQCTMCLGSAVSLVATAATVLIG